MSKYNPFLYSKSIYLREVRVTDANKQYYLWLNDPAINQYLETRYYPQSLEAIKNFINSQQNNQFFAICCNNTDLHIGNIKLNILSEIHRRADLSLFIGNKDFWGKGIASEAIEQVTQFGFNQLNLNRIQAGIYHPNIASIKAFEKVGFIREGCLKEFSISNNTKLDLYYYGLTRESFYEQSL